MNGTLDLGLIAGVLDGARPLSYPILVLAFDEDSNELVLVIGRNVSPREARSWAAMSVGRLDAYMADPARTSGVIRFPAYG